MFQMEISSDKIRIQILVTYSSQILHHQRLSSMISNHSLWTRSRTTWDSHYTSNRSSYPCHMVDINCRNLMRTRRRKLMKNSRRVMQRRSQKRIKRTSSRKRTVTCRCSKTAHSHSFEVASHHTSPNQVNIRYHRQHRKRQFSQRLHTLDQT